MKYLDMLRRAFFWPGTKLTEKLNINPDSEFGLLRSMFNTLIWTAIGLGILFIVIF
jgi:hypothetical protein